MRVMFFPEELAKSKAMAMVVDAVVSLTCYGSNSKEYKLSKVKLADFICKGSEEDLNDLRVILASVDTPPQEIEELISSAKKTYNELL